VRAEGFEDLLDVDLYRVARVAGVAEHGARLARGLTIVDF
jgi:hypothetical protein